MSKREIAVLFVRIITLQLFLTCLEKFEVFLRMAAQISTSIYQQGATTTAPPILGRAPFFPNTTANWSVYSPLGQVTQDNWMLMLAINLALVSVWFLVVGGLWYGAPRIAFALVQEFPGDSPLNTHGLDIPRLAFSLLGIYMLTGIVPNIVSNLLAQIWETVRWTSSAGPGSMPRISWHEYVRLFVALWLTFGTRGIVGIIYQAREWGKQSLAPKNSPVS